MELKKSLVSLNNARLGSFGEFIFVETVKRVSKVEIMNQHNGRVDFLVDNKSVDVKATRQKIDKYCGCLKSYKGMRYKGINYAYVEFFVDGVRVSLEDKQIDFLSWQDVKELWEKWKKGDVKRNVSPYSKIKKHKLDSIESEIKKFFKKRNIETRIIYRTCQEIFGDEVPGNLKPIKQKSNRITIFLDFKSESIDRDNLERIIAFPDSLSEELHMQKKTRLHMPKVDLNKIPIKFVFHDLDDIKKNYSKMFS